MLYIKRTIVLAFILAAPFWSAVVTAQNHNVLVPLAIPTFSYMPISEHEPQVDMAGRKVLQQISHLLEKQDYQGAMVELRHGLKTSKPTNAALWYTLASIELRQNQTESAVSSLTQALEAFPDFTRAQSVLAGIYTRQGEFDKARPLLQAAIKRQASAGLYGMLAYGYLKQQTYVAAKAAYQQALVLDGLNSSYLKGLLQVTMVLQEWSSANNILQALLALQDADTELLLVRASIAQRQKNDIAAINSLRLALNQIKTTNEQAQTIRWQLAQLYLKVGAYNSANDTLASLGSSNRLPESKQLVATLDYLLIKGQTKQVKQLANGFMSHPQSNSELDSQLWMLVGRAELSDGRNVQANNAFAKAVKADPLNGEAFIQQALLLKSSNKQQAQILLARAADIDGTAVRALTLQAQLLLEMKAYDRALLALTQAYNLAPDTQGIKDNLRSVERLVKLTQIQN